jgi:hypothetical protein
MAIVFNGNGTHANGALATAGNSGEARVAAELFMVRLPLGLVQSMPSSAHILSTRFLISLVIFIGRPHCRSVSPGHFVVASKPILEPSPEVGLAKSR